jgi:DNA-binding response OmpR family regulator
MATRRRAILIIEDDDDIRVLFRMILEAAGYAVDTVRTQTAAQTYLLMRVYDLILTDWKLGSGGDGLKIADAAHKNGIVAIIVTGKHLSFPITTERATRYSPSRWGRRN